MVTVIEYWQGVQGADEVMLNALLLEEMERPSLRLPEVVIHNVYEVVAAPVKRKTHTPRPFERQRLEVRNSPISRSGEGIGHLG